MLFNYHSSLYWSSTFEHRWNSEKFFDFLRFLEYSSQKRVRVFQTMRIGHIISSYQGTWRIIVSRTELTVWTHFSFLLLHCVRCIKLHRRFLSTHKLCYVKRCAQLDGFNRQYFVCYQSGKSVFLEQLTRVRVKWKFIILNN